MIDISDRLFIVLMLPSIFVSFGVFFVGIGYLWRVSIEDRARRGR